MQLLIIPFIGSVLLFVGTPVAYSFFATSSNKHKAETEIKGCNLPLLSDMFAEWPLLSSSCTGVGMTLLFSGITVNSVVRMPSMMDVQVDVIDSIVWMSSVQQAVIWIVVCTSGEKGFPPTVIGILHYAAAFVCMVVPVVILHYMDIIFTAIAVATIDSSLQMACWWIRCNIWIASCGVLAALAAVGRILHLRKDAGFSHWRQLLVVGELSILGACGMGYFTTMYCFSTIEVDIATLMIRQ